MHQRRDAKDAISRRPRGGTYDIPDTTPDSGAVRHLPGDSADAPFETHWTRILYYDLFAADAGDGSLGPVPRAQVQSARPPESALSASALHKEISVAIKASRRHIGASDIRSQIRATAILLGFYIAMYLAVAGVLHVLSGSDAVAASIEDAPSMRAVMATTAATLSAETVDSAGNNRHEKATGSTESARKCTPSAAVDSDCIFN